LHLFLQNLLLPTSNLTGIVSIPASSAKTLCGTPLCTFPFQAIVGCNTAFTHTVGIKDLCSNSCSGVLAQVVAIPQAITGCILISGSSAKALGFASFRTSGD